LTRKIHYTTILYMEDEKWHGTVNGYKNWGCRCPLCTKANAIAQREWRERAQERRAKQVSETPAPYVPERRRRLPE